MNHKQIWALLVYQVLLIPMSAAPQHAAAQQKIIRYADLGELLVQAVESAGGPPKLVISKVASDRDIFSTSLGENILPEMVSRPSLRFVIVDGPKSQSPYILAMAMSPGGSDCGYEGIVVGELGHRLVTLTRMPVNTNAEGGIYLGDLGESMGFGLAVWNFIWREDESHFDKHRYEVTLYRFDSAQSRFRLIRKVVSKQKYEESEQALLELGFQYKNMMRDFPEFSC